MGDCASKASCMTLAHATGGQALPTSWQNSSLRKLHTVIINMSATGQAYVVDQVVDGGGGPHIALRILVKAEKAAMLAVKLRLRLGCHLQISGIRRVAGLQRLLVLVEQLPPGSWIETVEGKVQAALTAIASSSTASTWTRISSCKHAPRCTSTCR